MRVAGVGVVGEKRLQEGARQSALRKSLGDGGCVQDGGNVPVLREIKECRADGGQHLVEFGDLLLT